MLLHRFVRWTMIGSTALAVAGWWMKDALPPPERIHPEVLEAPVQTRVHRPPLETSLNGVAYRIQPRYAYDLAALVVSLHHSDTWWDYAHKEWGDHVNILDLCVVWGGNAQSGAYRSVSFSNTQWECHWQWFSAGAGEQFRSDEVSNNHIVADRPDLVRALKSIRVGDQVRVRGYLVDYTILREGRPAVTRVSSEIRSDQGPGACEVLYVADVEILSSAGKGWRLAMKFSLWVLLASVLAWLALPVRFDN